MHDSTGIEYGSTGVELSGADWAFPIGEALDTATFGATNSPLGGVLANAASDIAVEVLRDPYVSARLEQAQVECKTQAKRGVEEYARENWHHFAIGGAALIFANWLMLTLGVIPLVSRRK